MFTQVLFLAGNHKKLSPIHATLSFVADSKGEEQKIEKKKKNENSWMQKMSFFKSTNFPFWKNYGI